MPGNHVTAHNAVATGALNSPFEVPGPVSIPLHANVHWRCFLSQAQTSALGGSRNQNSFVVFGITRVDGSLVVNDNILT
jgi:hypothetical protein